MRKILSIILIFICLSSNVFGEALTINQEKIALYNKRIEQIGEEIKQLEEKAIKIRAIIIKINKEEQWKR